MEAWPAESTKRSRFGQIGSSGSKRSCRCQSAYATGAIAMGVPGCPEFACCTASIASVRIVFTQRVSSEVSVMSAPSVPSVMRGRGSEGDADLCGQHERIRNATRAARAKNTLDVGLHVEPGRDVVLIVQLQDRLVLNPRLVAHDP